MDDDAASDDDEVDYVMEIGSETTTTMSLRIIFPSISQFYYSITALIDTNSGRIFARRVFVQLAPRVIIRRRFTVVVHSETYATPPPPPASK